MKFKHRMTGYDELRQTLQRMEVAVQRQVSVAALKEAAEPIRAEHAALAPRSSGAGPHMAGNIIVAETQFGGSDGPDVDAVAVGPRKEFWYAEFQEHGTAHHQAQPSARPAFDSKKREARKIIAAAFWRAIKSAVVR